MLAQFHIDSPSINDNRSYDYANHPELDRHEYSIIIDLVKQGSRVIDLGCGNGTLLSRLKKEKNVVEAGMELSESGVSVCKQKGLNVQYGRIDERLPFNDNTFDYAICNVTIQMVMYPEILLKEMKRISRCQIISFPNFAFWRNRVELLFCGRMPRKMLFGYSWYSTGHIHQLSPDDFRTLVNDVGNLRIIDRRSPIIKNFFKRVVANLFPQLFHMVFVYLLEKHESVS